MKIIDNINYLDFKEKNNCYSISYNELIHLIEKGINGINKNTIILKDYLPTDFHFPNQLINNYIFDNDTFIIKESNGLSDNILIISENNKINKSIKILCKNKITTQSCVKDLNFDDYGLIIVEKINFSIIKKIRSCQKDVKFIIDENLIKNELYYAMHFMSYEIYNFKEIKLRQYFELINSFNKDLISRNKYIKVFNIHDYFHIDKNNSISFFDEKTNNNLRLLKDKNIIREYILRCDLPENYYKLLEISKNSNFIKIIKLLLSHKNSNLIKSKVISFIKLIDLNEKQEISNNNNINSLRDYFGLLKLSKELEPKKTERLPFDYRVHNIEKFRNNTSYIDSITKIYNLKVSDFIAEKTDKMHIYVANTCMNFFKENKPMNLNLYMIVFFAHKNYFLNLNNNSLRDAPLPLLTLIFLHHENNEDINDAINIHYDQTYPDHFIFSLFSKSFQENVIHDNAKNAFSFYLELIKNIPTFISCPYNIARILFYFKFKNKLRYYNFINLYVQQRSYDIKCVEYFMNLFDDKC